ncbi:hypothetical protein EMCRGX_G003990 [Ephydatia muelleri]
MAFVQIIQKPHEPLWVPLNDQGHLPKAQVKAINSRTTGLIYSPCRTIQIVGDMFVPPINGWPERLHLYKDTALVLETPTTPATDVVQTAVNYVIQVFNAFEGTQMATITATARIVTGRKVGERGLALQPDKLKELGLDIALLEVMKKEGHFHQSKCSMRKGKIANCSYLFLKPPDDLEEDTRNT